MLANNITQAPARTVHPARCDFIPSPSPTFVSSPCRLFRLSVLYQFVLFGLATPTNAADCVSYSRFSFVFFGLKLLVFGRAALGPWPHMSRPINCSGGSTDGADRLHNVRLCTRHLLRSHRHLGAWRRLLPRMG